LAAFRLIKHEGERITAQSRSAEVERVRAIADNVRLVVSSVEDELGEEPAPRFQRQRLLKA